MPLPGGSAGRGRRPQWPLAAAWAVPVASLLVIALFRRTAAHAYGTLLLAGSAGSLIVVLVYARLLRWGRRRRAVTAAAQMTGTGRSRTCCATSQTATPGRLPVSSGRRAVVARG